MSTTAPTSTSSSGRGSIVTVQSATYFLGVCLFSISFLVFLNASVSFVIADVIGIERGIGDLVGTLGFVDELVALAACPAWGLLSDIVGARLVCVIGYTIVGLALFVFVQAENVYPQLLLARILFSLGGAATSTMVTAILPSIVMVHGGASGGTAPPSSTDAPSSERQGTQHSVSPSLSSELTITPARLARTANVSKDAHLDDVAVRPASPSLLAGFVGFFTGCGALLALVVFLPLPAQFQTFRDVSPAAAVTYTYYVVGFTALVVALACLLGLRDLGGEKGGRRMREGAYGGDASGNRAPYVHGRALWDAALLGFRDSRIGLGYVGGFVARASSVGISLFIPLIVKAYFISSGLCEGNPYEGNDETKRQCRRAYVLAAELTGVSQLVALVCAPIFGFVSDRYGAYNVPLLTAAVVGIVSHLSFGLMPSPEAGGKRGSPVVFVIVALQGINQIGCIVCSLGLIGKGIIDDGAQDIDLDGGLDEVESGRHMAQVNGNGGGDPNGSSPRTEVSSFSAAAHAPDESTRLLQREGFPFPHPSSSPPRSSSSHSSFLFPSQDPDERVPADGDDGQPRLSSPPAAAPPPPPSHAPLLSPAYHLRGRARSPASRSQLYHLKGSIAGVYSLVGGAAILLLTKLGGFLFDRLSPGTPFFMLAIFNGILLGVGLIVTFFSSSSSSSSESVAVASTSAPSSSSTRRPLSPRLTRRASAT